MTDKEAAEFLRNQAAELERQAKQMREKAEQLCGDNKDCGSTKQAPIIAPIGTPRRTNRRDRSLEG